MGTVATAAGQPSGGTMALDMALDMVFFFFKEKHKYYIRENTNCQQLLAEE